MINLPSILDENSWFFKEDRYKEQLTPHLGKPYISYSSVGSWVDYKDDFIKQKLVGIKLPEGIYGKFGSWVGEATELGYFEEVDPNEFAGQENYDFTKYRKPNAEYEKLIVIDRGDYIILGFIDIFYIDENGVANLEDQKTGGKGKEKQYEAEEYIQTVLYAHAIEKVTGLKSKTGINFIRREGSHVNKPLKISKEQFYIPLEYNEERVKFALNKVDKAVKGISELKTTYDKFFK